jgi:hypothetical protein
VERAETAADCVYRTKLAACITAYTVGFIDTNNAPKFAFAEVSLISGTVFATATLWRSESYNMHCCHYVLQDEMEWIINKLC